MSVPVQVPESDADVPKWTGDFSYNTAIGGQPPAEEGDGKGEEGSVRLPVIGDINVTPKVVRRRPRGTY